MGWLFVIVDEKEKTAEVSVSYAGSELEIINTDIGEIIANKCSMNITFNYKRLLRKAGMKNGLKQYDNRTVDQFLVNELGFIEANLELMCVGREPSNDYWNGNDPYNVLEFVRWFRNAAIELVARDGKFTCWVH